MLQRSFNEYVLAAVPPATPKTSSSTQLFLLIAFALHACDGPAPFAVGFQLTEGSRVNVPVQFAPNSMEMKRAWVCISMRPLGNPGRKTRWDHVHYNLPNRP